MSNESSGTGSWWSTLPGILTATASQVKLRDDIREWCSGAALKSVQGQSIGMDLMRRFEVVDWTSGSSKGTVKIVLNNGQVLNEKIDACGFRGRNDLGDFVGDFDKIRSVEFVR
jgi:hypothetical protein